MTSWWVSRQFCLKPLPLWIWLDVWMFINISYISTQCFFFLSLFFTSLELQVKATFIIKCSIWTRAQWAFLFIHLYVSNSNVTVLFLNCFSFQSCSILFIIQWGISLCNYEISFTITVLLSLFSCTCYCWIDHNFTNIDIEKKILNLLVPKISLHLFLLFSLASSPSPVFSYLRCSSST